MPKEINALAIEIIAATNDGDDLAPHHLKLVEMAVNGYLNDEGMVAFHELAEQVRAGYRKPWFHGIEHLTLDSEGWVYWKEYRVEHYTPRWAYSDEAKRQAQMLARKCKYLEAKGEDVRGALGVEDWELGDADNVCGNDCPTR